MKITRRGLFGLVGGGLALAGVGVSAAPSVPPDFDPAWTQERFDQVVAMYREEFGHEAPAPVWAHRDTLDGFNHLTFPVYWRPVASERQTRVDNTLAQGVIQFRRRFYSLSTFPILSFNSNLPLEVLSQAVTFYLSGGWVVMEWTDNTLATVYRMRGPEGKTVKGVRAGCPGM